MLDELCLTPTCQIVSLVCSLQPKTAGREDFAAIQRAANVAINFQFGHLSKHRYLDVKASKRFSRNNVKSLVQRI
jgi:hypothetical protein